MKKILVILGMVTCLLGITACQGENEVVDNYGVSEEQAVIYGENLIENMNGVVMSGLQGQYEDQPIIYNGLMGFSAALEEIGEYQTVVGYSVRYDDGIIIEMEISGTLRNGTVEIITDENGEVSSISTNVIYGFGEMMAKAGLNTLMGMGTVFAVLILISLLISGFSLIGKVQNSSKKESDTKEAVKDRVIEPIIEKEELSDDLELVAVISAAIAAYEGAASSDGYIVRSIRKRNR